MSARMVLPVTGAHGGLVTRRRVVSTTGRRPLIYGLVVLDGAGALVEVVSPFGSETAARQWADLYGVESYQVLPARIAGGRR
ncbi:hypothetical protein [Parafrankia sp. BMG5.11]|uniref:hypothetical protein n=1 Tax=Parafrankia sp. BMG5.11 TaxID=222540 RepID=UPI0010390FA5|nr:hypothetical protein [Parafrankia sp. BMG5.11]TCJ34168.1 hypothetical protein E0504_33370 [Parafrankia sp. BMG5.11]